MKKFIKAYFSKMNSYGNNSYPFNHLEQMKTRKPVEQKTLPAKQSAVIFDNTLVKIACSLVLFAIAVLVLVDMSSTVHLFTSTM